MKISAGSYDLNKWLFGGYESDIVSVIYGAPGTGKTNFVLLAAVSQAKKGNKAIFIDTEGGFSSERIKQLALDNYEEVLENILILKPTNFTEQKAAFQELEKHMKKQVGLIVVDSMTILYRLDFAAAREKGEDEIRRINAELVNQMKILAEIARKRSIPVIVTNQVYKWKDEDKAVAGDILKYWGKCLIELKLDNGKRTAFLQKHRSLPQKQFEFQITQNGIRRRGWI